MPEYPTDRPDNSRFISEMEMKRNEKRHFEAANYIGQIILRNYEQIVREHARVEVRVELPQNMIVFRDAWEVHSYKNQFNHTHSLLVTPQKQVIDGYHSEGEMYSEDHTSFSDVLSDSGQWAIVNYLMNYKTEIMRENNNLDDPLNEVYSAVYKNCL